MGVAWRSPIAVEIGAGMIGVYGAVGVADANHYLNEEAASRPAKSAETKLRVEGSQRGARESGDSGTVH